MSYRNVSSKSLAILFCLAVVRSRWPGRAPTLTDAAEELGVSRELAPRLRSRFFEPLVALIERLNRPGPTPRDREAGETHKRLRVVEALLGVARAVIVVAGVARLSPERREEIVVAVERLRAEHGISYEQTAEKLGFDARTLRRWRERMRKGESPAPRSRAPRRPHGKLPRALASAVFSFVSLFPRKVPLAELHRRFTGEQAELCAQHGHPEIAYTTFCRHAGRSDETEKEEERRSVDRGRDAPEKIPPRALALMDTTDLRCFGFAFKLIPFMEAHSRNIFAHQLCDRESAERISKVLEQGNKESGGAAGLRIDRGAPYMAELTSDTAGEQGIDIRVARAHTPTDKALIERFFLTAKDALRSVLECIDLREGPGDISWRRKLARTIGSAVIAAYLRWGYPFIPQPHIDGKTPEERARDEEQYDEDVIRSFLDRRVNNHEHKKTVAGELHHDYGFLWSMKRWMKAVRYFTAEDLREASRRFDEILLRSCFNCDSRRNPLYLLAIARTVAGERKKREREDRRKKELKRKERNKEQAHRDALEKELRLLKDEPEQAAMEAVDLAGLSFQNRGFGLDLARRKLDESLVTIAGWGDQAYRLATDRILHLNGNEALRAWLEERIERARPPSRPIGADLDS